MRDSADCCATIRARRCQLPPDSKLKSSDSGAQELRIDVLTSLCVRHRARAVAWLGDEPIPGVAQLELVDGAGRTWVFQEKAMMFNIADLVRRDSSYPMDIDLPVTVRRCAPTGIRERVVVSTAEICQIETVDGKSEFIMRPDQVRTFSEDSCLALRRMSEDGKPDNFCYIW